MSTDTKNTQQSAYSDFHLQYIAGSWQQGKDDSVNTDVNPYNGDTLVEIKQATKEQLDELLMSYVDHERLQELSEKILAIFKK